MLLLQITIFHINNLHLYNIIHKYHKISLAQSDGAVE